MAERGAMLAFLLLLAACDAAVAPVEAAAHEEAAFAPADASGIVADGDSFACTPTKLWDGDGPIHCAEGPRVRLSGIAAREADGSCRPGHPCPDASAQAARDTLAALLGRVTGTAREGHLLIEGPTIFCTSAGSAGGKRTAAWCVSPTAGDLSCAMVASGTAAKWDRYWRGHACG